MGGLSFHTSLFGDYSIEETVAILVDLGFNAIELNMESSPDFHAHLTPDATPDERAAIVETIRRSGLCLSSLSPHCDMIPADERMRQEAIEYIHRSIDLAVDLGTDIVHIASGWITEEAGEDLCWQWMVEATRACVDYGRERDVKVAMEAGVFPGLIVWSPETLLKLIELVGYDDFYVNFDPSHFAAAGLDAVAAFLRLQDRIINVHAKDGRGGRDAFEFPALGDGDVDWPGLAQALIDIDYKGYVAVEYEAHFFSKGYPKDPPGAARQSKEFLDRVLADWLQ